MPTQAHVWKAGRACCQYGLNKVSLDQTEAPQNGGSVQLPSPYVSGGVSSKALPLTSRPVRVASRRHHERVELLTEDSRLQ